MEKNYEVWGLIRRASNFNTQRIDHLYSNNNLKLRYGDLTDYGSINSIITEITNNYKSEEIEQFEIYNLGAQSHVKVSYELPEYSANVDAIGTLRILEIVRNSPIVDKIRFYQASTSELYGKVQEISTDRKDTILSSFSIWSSKVICFFGLLKNYREAYNLFACNGILYNHESPRRGPTFVTKKITRELNKILKGDFRVYNIRKYKCKKRLGTCKRLCRRYVENVAS